VVRGGFGRKIIAKILSNTERMENTAIHVCGETALSVDLQQKVGELVLSITCPSIIILENTLKNCVYKTCGCGNFSHWDNLFPIQLHELLGGRKFYEGGPRASRPNMKWSAIAESSRNTNT
jgi:hypothetical protein